MKTGRMLLIGISLLFLLQVAPAHASSLPIVSGGLTATAILDGSLNFLGIDIRGNVTLDTGLGNVLLTDALASPTFGNLDLTGEPVIPDGTAVDVAFQTPSLVILPGPDLSAMTLGTTIAGPLSSAEAVLLSQLQFTFDLVTVAPYGANAQDVAATFALASVSAPSSVPEPAMPLFCAAGMLVVLAARSHRKILKRLKG